MPSGRTSVPISPAVKGGVKTKNEETVRNEGRMCGCLKRVALTRHLIYSLTGEALELGGGGRQEEDLEFGGDGRQEEALELGGGGRRLVLSF